MDFGPNGPNMGGMGGMGGTLSPTPASSRVPGVGTSRAVLGSPTAR